MTATALVVLAWIGGIGFAWLLVRGGGEREVPKPNVTPFSPRKPWGDRNSAA